MTQDKHESKKKRIEQYDAEIEKIKKEHDAFFEKAMNKATLEEFNEGWAAFDNKIVAQLIDLQGKYIDCLIIPSGKEFKRMVTKKLNIRDYLKLPSEKRRKWYVSATEFPHTDVVPDYFFVGFACEPWHPNILKCIY